MRHHRMSFRPTLFFRELSLSKSWFSYMAPTLYKRFGRECSRIRSDGRRFGTALLGRCFSFLYPPTTKTLRRIGVRQSADIIRIFYLFYIFHHLLIKLVIFNLITNSCIISFCTHLNTCSARIIRHFYLFFIFSPVKIIFRFF